MGDEMDGVAVGVKVNLSNGLGENLGFGHDCLEG
jgi:hypothetical protein